MPRLRYKPSKRAIFGILMLLSAVTLFLLPKDWSDALKHAGQLLIPLQDTTYRVAHSATSSLCELDPNDHERRDACRSLLHELASQVLANEALRIENARLLSLREGRNAGLPPSVPLLSAKVVARDIVAWRDALLVQRGSSHGVHRKDWVASRFFVDRGYAQGVAEGQLVIEKECLLGRVEHVSPYMARVQLLSDIDSPRIEVRVGGLTDDGFEFADYPCSLGGLGRGRMVIEDVPYKYVEDTTDDDGRRQDQDPGSHRRRIQVGDLVFSAPEQFGLPVPLVIGKVVELKENPRKRLVVSLLVEPTLTTDQLRDVFIIPLVPLDRIPLRE
ncbi:MAG: hypothetical protein JXQ75_12490 [Phycisphaerae bacterium]|nr:hypothetical protein [Phycisphaerae bacterium]